MATAQFTSLLENSTLARVERMRLTPLRRLTNRSRGEHLAGKGGTSTEFNDYRDYVAGDDMRYVDWNIFSRLNRPYLKLYRHEEEMHVVVLLDASSSMLFGSKFERARQLAASFSIMGLMNLERVSIFSCNQQGRALQMLPPTTGRPSLRRVLEFLERLEPGGDFPIDLAVSEVLKQHRGRGIAILLSDFLTFGALDRPFNHLFSAGLETFAVQILAPEELHPDLNGDLRFVDSETSQTLDITSAGELLGLYHQHLTDLQEYLAQVCRQRNGRCLTIDSSTPIDTVLFDTLRRRGWVR
ncbi:MAG TPA: DUF58 domain-containing protein [Planctomycetaceae bacterium]|nr:DUF58 domain-containing protein [Planctomycetaceae bacterium]